MLAILPMQAQGADNIIVITLNSPVGPQQSRGLGFDAVVPPGTPTVVSYVKFWVDLPQSQITNPRPRFTCPNNGHGGCQYMATDDEATVDGHYSKAAIYRGPSGRHTATVQAWRFGDPAPVFLGQDSKVFTIG